MYYVTTIQTTFYSFDFVRFASFISKAIISSPLFNACFANVRGLSFFTFAIRSTSLTVSESTLILYTLIASLYMVMVLGAMYYIRVRKSIGC